MGMRILWSAVSLLVVAGLALLLWNAASGTDRVEVVRGGVSVSGSPAPDPSAGTAPPAGDPSSSPSPTGPAQDGGDAPGPDRRDAGRGHIRQGRRTRGTAEAALHPPDRHSWRR